MRPAPAFASWSTIEASADLTPKVLAALPHPDVVLNQPAPPVKNLHRRWRDADLYFFFNESDQPQHRVVKLAGRGHAEVWDAMTDQVMQVAGVSAQDDGVSVPLDLAAYESKFIVIQAANSSR